MKIAILSAVIGKDYEEKIKYGKKSRQIYCDKHGYDYIENVSITRKNFPPQWEKLSMLKQYQQSNYDYLVWMDADTLITNMDIKLENIINTHMKNFTIMIAKDNNWINSGVIFCKKDPEFNIKFIDECFKYPNEMCFDQGAIWKLYVINWNFCRNNIILVSKTLFNSEWNEWEWNHFLIHFPGTAEPGRPKNCLFRMMSMFSILKTDEENDENYEKRLKWLQTKAHNELKNQRQYRIFPLD